MIRILFFILFVPVLTFAQLEQPNRFETELDNNDDQFEVITGGENGVILYRSVNKYNKKGGRLWEFILLDTS